MHSAVLGIANAVVDPPHDPDSILVKLLDDAVSHCRVWFGADDTPFLPEDAWQAMCELTTR